MNSVVQERPVAHSGHVGQSIQHLNRTTGDYLEGRLPPARLTHCSTHWSLRGMPRGARGSACIQERLTGFAHPEPAGGAGSRQRPQTDPGLRDRLHCRSSDFCGPLVGVAQTAAKETPVTVAVAHTTTALCPQSPYRLATHNSTTKSPRCPASVRPVVSEAIRRWQAAASVAGERVSQARSRSTAGQRGIRLVGSFRRSHCRSAPRISLAPLAGAVLLLCRHCRYEIASRAAQPRAAHNELATSATLRRGQTYLWQVTATLRGGSTIVRCLPGRSRASDSTQLADELEQFSTKNTKTPISCWAHLRAGWNADRECERAQKGRARRPVYTTARTLLESLPSTSPDETSRVVLQATDGSAADA